MSTHLQSSPTRSVGLFRQIVGRGTRVLPGVIEGVEDVDARKTAIAASAKKDRSPFFDACGRPAKAAFADRRQHVSDSPEEIADANGRVAKGNVVENVRREREEKANAKPTPPPNATRNSSRSKQSPVWSMRRTSSRINQDFAWEREIVTEKQGATLRKFGIDPEKVRSKGHASKIADILIRRADRGFASLQTTAARAGSAVSTRDRG